MREAGLFSIATSSLVNDKYQHFQRTYGQFGLRTIRVTGEIPTIDMLFDSSLERVASERAMLMRYFIEVSNLRAQFEGTIGEIEHGIGHSSSSI